MVHIAKMACLIGCGIKLMPFRVRRKYQVIKEVPQFETITFLVSRGTIKKDTYIYKINLKSKATR